MSRKADLGSSAAAVSGVKGVPPGYEVLRSCGEGTFGQVFLCKSDTGKHVAIKTIKQEGSKQETEGVPLATIREASLLKELWHPNILHLESVYVNNNSSDFALSLVFEFVDHDLHEIMQIQKNQTGRQKQLADEYFPSEMVCSIMWQILRGLEYLHTNWIIHRDMKPSNILVTGMADSHPGQVRIADFGLARVYRSPSRPLYENGVVVTIWYRAPELLLGATHYTPAVDMWAAGCIFGELLTLKPMFPGSEVREPLDAFQQNQLHRIMSIMGHINEDSWPGIANTVHWKRNTQDIRTPRPEYQERLEQHLLQANPNLKTDPRFAHAVDLAQKLLQYHPGKRLTAREALNHPYFKHEPLPGMNCYPQGYNLRMPSKVTREGQKKKVTAGASNAASGGAAAASARLSQGAAAARAANAIAAGKAKPSNLSKASASVKKVIKKPGVTKKVKPSKG